MSNLPFGLNCSQMQEASQRSDALFAARRAAEATKESSGSLEQLLEAMRASLELSQAAKADADRTQRFGRNASIASLAIAIASLGVAIVALVIGGASTVGRLHT